MTRDDTMTHLENYSRHCYVIETEWFSRMVTRVTRDFDNFLSISIKDKKIANSIVTRVIDHSIAAQPSVFSIDCESDGTPPRRVTHASLASQQASSRSNPGRAKRVAIYLRVSTASRSRQGDRQTFDQDPAVQEGPLLQLLAHRGWQLHRIYSDRMSGSKEKRPGLDELMADARRGMFDVVVVWRFDRFARSIRQLVNALHEFKELGIDFISHQEAVDTSTAMGNVLFVVIAAMAELERSVIRERVIAGLDHARRNGTKSGKSIGRPFKIFRRDQAVELRTKGLSFRQIGRHLGVPESTVRRTLALATAPEPSRNPLEEEV